METESTLSHLNVKISPKGEEVSWESLADLLHEAFEERLGQGLQFTCSSITAAELEQECEGSIVLVAVDSNTQALAGTVSIRISEGRGIEPWAYHFNLAVNPAYKHCGVATRLFGEFQNIARQNGCDHIISDTAEQAHSSVAWHKKNGFYPVSLHSFWYTNYYSIIFRKQLKPHSLWSSPVFCKVHYWFSALKCRATFRKDGRSRYFMSLYVKMKNM